MLLLQFSGLDFTMASRDYVDTVTAVAAYAWHVDFIINIYYTSAVLNASESGDALSEELCETDAK